MKAIRYTHYGDHDVLKIEETEKPEPGANEILVKIHAASVTRADTMMRKGRPYLGRLMLGICKPKYTGVGTGFAGAVEAVGSKVTSYKMGDAVFGESIFGSGSNAEYVCVPEDGVITKKPENISFSEACSVCDGPLTSLNFLREVGQIKKEQKVIIVGASGSLGSAAIQIAKYYGATVTAVCSGRNSLWVKELGADFIIDYTKEDFTQAKQQYDIIYDTVGKHSFSSCKYSLTAHGVYLSPVFGIGNLLQMLWTSKFSDKKAKFSATGMRPANELRVMLNELKGLFEDNKLQTIIDRQFFLEETADAHAYVDKGHKKGNVVIVV